jgi:hypothetical protein
VPYRHNFELTYMHDSVDILGLASTGVGFLCTQLATVYTQLAVAMGWTPRYLLTRNPQGDEHATNEIWSNQYNKWVFVDVTWNVHVEKSGIPQSALEVRREWLANKGRNLVYVFGAGATETRYTSLQFPVKRNDNKAWQLWPLDDSFAAYLYDLAWLRRNDFFSNNLLFWDNVVIYKDSANAGDDGWSFGNEPEAEVPMIYHDVNRVDIHVASRDARLVTVKLDAQGPRNVTPNFKEFVVRANGGDWQTLQGDTLTLGATGANTVIQARIRNKFGVLGPVTTRSLRPYALPLNTRP